LKNQICYPPKDHEEKCPITELKFVDKSIADTEYLNNYRWTVVDFTSTHSLVYNKVSDRLPVTGTSLT